MVDFITTKTHIEAPLFQRHLSYVLFLALLVVGL